MPRYYSQMLQESVYPVCWIFQMLSQLLVKCIFAGCSISAVHWLQDSTSLLPSIFAPCRLPARRVFLASWQQKHCITLHSDNSDWFCSQMCTGAPAHKLRQCKVEGLKIVDFQRCWVIPERVCYQQGTSQVSSRLLPNPDGRQLKEGKRPVLQISLFYCRVTPNN